MKESDVDRISVPVGKPMNGAQVMILDSNMQNCAIGSIGEIYIRTPFTSAGYYKDSDSTRKVFIKNPFNNNPKDIIYKTGDLGMMLSSGDVEVLGRIDHQVKLRGVRIELEEIENQLLQFDMIKEAVVVAREDEANNKYLCAYIIGVEGQKLEVAKIREHLQKILPDYMVPSNFMQLDQMPITPNGKIDRKALPEPEQNLSMGTEYVGPRNEIEEKLVNIWSEILETEGIGINHNFFMLGGHSLNAITLVGKIYKEFNVKIPLIEIFKRPTLKEISEYIQKTRKTAYEIIERVKEAESYPGFYEASSAQKRIYMLQHFNKLSTGYNMPSVLEIEGRLNLEKVENAFLKLIERHETLRTSFETIEEKIVQKVNAPACVKLEFNLEHLEKTDKTVKEMVQEFVRPFDLSKAPLFRARVIRLEEDQRYILMFDMHHIISDGISQGILINEFGKLYEGQELESLRIQYKDYAEWQNKLLKSERMKEQEEYWIQRFSDETGDNAIPVLNLPTDYVPTNIGDATVSGRPTIQSHEGDRISFTLDKELTKDLKRIAKVTGSTMYMILLSGVTILLSKYSAQEDIIVGSPIAGRPHADLEKIIGMFVNTLAMRNHPEGNKTYEEFLMEVRENSLKDYEKQDYQFEKLIDKLNLKNDKILRDLSRNPLFDVMFVLQNMANEEVNVNDLKLKSYNYKNKISKFDLTIIASEIVSTDMEEEIIVIFEYCIKLFKRETIERMILHFKNILKAVTANMKIKLNDIEMLTEKEKDIILYDFNDTTVEYPKNKTLTKLFEEQVENDPNKTALIYNNQQMTYSELNIRANQLARTLRSKGVQPNQIIGIMIERSFEMLIGIWGILKAGGAYLPIDPDTPENRIGYMLRDSKADIVLTYSDYKNSIPTDDFVGEIIDLNMDDSFHKESSNIESINQVEDLAYVIYTSGTTGRPKGTLISHYNVNRLVKNTNYLKIDEKERILQLSNYVFDGSVFDIFAALLNGATLILVSKETIIEMNRLADLIIDNKITQFLIPTALFNTFVETHAWRCGEILAGVKKVYFGGERASIVHVQRALEYLGPDRLVNLYGPTESTVVATYYPINKQEEISRGIPIGKPISNTQIYILNKDGKQQPIGVWGELCISGDGVARGYLNQPELTTDKFISNADISTGRIYKTGDLARWLEDGNLEFGGRIDKQVQIRGFRIELAEIEFQLLSHNQIKEAAVVDLADKAGKVYLTAYLVADQDLKVADLRSFLSKTLPQYMIPAYFIQLPKLPLSINGKVDRKALPEPNLNEFREEYVKPCNEVEEKLAEIWSDVLGIDKVGIADNFFELGGHSLKATILAAKIHKELNVEIPLSEIFKTPTIKELSEYIQSATRTIYEAIVQVKESECYPIDYYETSSAQKRIYMLQQFDLNSTNYNISAVFTVEGNLDLEKLEKNFIALIERHETLRTSFETLKDQIVQRINKKVDFKLEYFEDIKSQNETVENIIKEFIRPFDLRKAPLFRVGVIRLEEDKHILIFDMHHIISDGTSMGILINEFAHLYEGQELDELRIQYKDYAEWQNKLFQSDTIDKQKEYWINKFSDEVPILNMPTDYARPAMQSHEGDCISFKLDREITKALADIAKETGSTMYMVLLSGINILLSNYSGQEDVIVGSPIAGRPHADLEKIIGMFVNTLVMRNYPEGKKTYEEVLMEVRENALKAYENQDIQFEELVDYLNIKRDLSRNPLFDVMFSLQNMQLLNVKSGGLYIDGLKFTPYNYENNIAKFDLTFSASEVKSGMDEEIILNLDYSIKLFKRETVERMLSHLRNIFKVVAANSKVKLSDIEMLTKEEKDKILNEFNNTFADYPGNKTIHELFEEQVVKTPYETAVVFYESQLTYKELNEKANRLAGKLRQLGVGPDKIVGILTEPSLEMVIGLMSILKAGGAYVPIDVQYSAERIEYILNDVNAEILLIQEQFKDKIQSEQFEFHGQVLSLDNFELDNIEISNLSVINQPTNLAYVIYTSGSSGQPKGVMIEHRNAINVLTWFGRKYALKPGKRIMQMTNYTFDPSVEQIFSTLTHGATVYLINHDLLASSNKFGQFIEENKIQIINFVPSTLKELLLKYDKKFSSLEVVISGGERLDETIKDEILNRGYTLYNHYGQQRQPLMQQRICVLKKRCQLEDQLLIQNAIFLIIVIIWYQLELSVNFALQVQELVEDI